MSFTLLPSLKYFSTGKTNAFPSLSESKYTTKEEAFDVL